MIQQYHSWEYTQRNETQVTPKALAHPCSLQHHSQEEWKQPRCPTINEWIKKMWHLYTMDSAMKKNEILSLAGKWMELENIILSEVSQAQKTKLICSPLYAHFRSMANTTRELDFDHMMRREHTREV
jgi:hypothetical protein